MKLKHSLLMAALLAAGSLTMPLQVQAAEQVTINKVAGMPADFIKGADVSMLAEVEKHGGKYFDANGKQMDAMQILKDNGFNYIRLRLWVDPKDADGKGYGGGNNDLATTIALAKRAKALGFKFLLDYHYSDFWTDPGRQNKPKAWANMNAEQLTKAVHDYTKSSFAEFKKAGVLPDMVQIGNEINGGMLWPEGKSWGQNGGEFDRLAGMLKAGISGVKENLAKDEQVKIMLHLAEGTKNDTFVWWFDEITKRNVEFDVIGLSFYTYWNGPISALKYNMDDIAKRYNKDLIVVEAAYGYTTDNCDNAENNFTAKEAADGGYPASVQGQADFLHDLMKSIVEVPGQRGKGIFYWEPAWLPTPGATWATKAGMKYNDDDWKEGNARENQSLFDCQGHVLPSIKVFN
ncbi:arabinogalactan endo-beta-1,4-galactanase [Pseudaeromonas sharmana]|uniref:Arabinogalactan endo-beta-1,4-galactanase n=1 Tax=Pseudaeromonas sharmana TaxID=328412 RepID=A0ABV8CIZ1_9GAMM